VDTRKLALIIFQLYYFKCCRTFLYYWWHQIFCFVTGNYSKSVSGVFTCLKHPVEVILSSNARTATGESLIECSLCHST